MKITAEPRSDQLNYEDFIGGSQIFTVAGVRVGTAEQKYDIGLEGEQRVWRPPLTVLRILIACWGNEADVWTGRQVELYGDPSIRFGKESVGGIRIARLSHLDGAKTVSVTESRGKRKKVTIQPLETAPATDWHALIEQAGGEQERLRAVWSQAQSEGAPQEVFDTITSIVNTQKEA